MPRNDDLGDAVGVLWTWIVAASTAVLNAIFATCLVAVIAPLALLNWATGNPYPVSIQIRMVTYRALYSVIGGITTTVCWPAIGFMLVGMDGKPNLLGAILLASPVVALVLGVWRIWVTWVKHAQWRRAWVKVEKLNRAFKWPIRMPRSPDGQAKLYYSIPHSQGLEMTYPVLEERVLTLVDHGTAHDELCGRIFGAVLELWGEVEWPKGTVYRMVLEDGSDSLWMKVYGTPSEKREAYVVAGVGVRKFGNLVQVNIGGKVSVKAVRGQSTRHELWRRNDYVHATRHWYQQETMAWRTLPLVACAFWPGFVNSDWEIGRAGDGMSRAIMQMSGKRGDSDDDWLIDRCREEGGGVMAFSPDEKARLEETLKELKTEASTSVQRTVSANN